MFVCLLARLLVSVRFGSIWFGSARIVCLLACLLACLFVCLFDCLFVAVLVAAVSLLGLVHVCRMIKIGVLFGWLPDRLFIEVV